jgi:pimeloyl-ACP methyl ester carboxylesterase
LISPTVSRRTLHAPDRRAAWGEVAGLLELPRLLLRAPSLARAPRGDGGPVMVLPGFATGDGATSILRGYLSFLGHDVHPWGLGRNDGDVPRLLALLVSRVAALRSSTGLPVRLVGWSLGGYLAREVSREIPSDVDRVVTLGAPVVGGPKYTLAARAYRRRGADMDAIEAAVDAREAVPLTRPVSAIYSRRDRVVAWQACVDERNGCVDHVEVSSTHLGLGFSPDVYLLVATHLSRNVM